MLDTTRDIQPRTIGLAVKDIVEVLSPYAGADAFYVGAKKNTTMVSFTPTTGRIINSLDRADSYVHGRRSL